MPNSASGQKYASGFDVTNLCGWSQLEYQVSTAQWPHYGFNDYTG